MTRNTQNLINDMEEALEKEQSNGIFRESCTASGKYSGAGQSGSTGRVGSYRRYTGSKGPGKAAGGHKKATGCGFRSIYF